MLFIKVTDSANLNGARGQKGWAFEDHGGRRLWISTEHSSHQHMVSIVPGDVVMQNVSYNKAFFINCNRLRNMFQL